MTSVNNEWYRWFSMKVTDVVVEGEHVFFRNDLCRYHGVTLKINGDMCFVSPEQDGDGKPTAMDLESVKQMRGGVLCRAGYGITDFLPRVHGVANAVLRDTADNIVLRTRKALESGSPVSADAATWAISICFAAAQGAHIQVGPQHHGVVFLVEDAYRVYTVEGNCVKRCQMWEFLKRGGVRNLAYVDNTPMTHEASAAAIAFCEDAIPKLSNWCEVQLSAATFCTSLRNGTVALLSGPPQDLIVHQIASELREKLAELERKMSHIVGQEQVKQTLTKMLEEVYSNKILVATGNQARPAEKSNMCFIGPSGTGKTTAATLLAEVLHWSGRLPTNKCVSVSGSDLIAAYVGQTALKTRKVVESAVGGLLFIDEAYVIGDNYDFGKVCIAELLKLIEQYEHNTVFVIAGYAEHIQKLTDINQGFGPRFQLTLTFREITLTQLTEILVVKLAATGLDIPNTVVLTDFMQEYTSAAMRKKKNGRIADVLAIEVRRNQSTRIAREALAGHRVNTNLIAIDFNLDRAALMGNTI